MENIVTRRSHLRRGVATVATAAALVAVASAPTAEAVSVIAAFRASPDEEAAAPPPPAVATGPAATKTKPRRAGRQKQPKVVVPARAAVALMAEGGQAQGPAAQTEFDSEALQSGGRDKKYSTEQGRFITLMEKLTAQGVKGLVFDVGQPGCLRSKRYFTFKGVKIYAGSGPNANPCVLALFVAVVRFTHPLLPATLLPVTLCVTLPTALFLFWQRPSP